MKKVLLVLLAVILLTLIAGYVYLQNANNFKQEGTFDISVNEQPIKIIRDDHGMAYVIAENKADVYRGQGFVVAQDRLFQVEFYRALIKGEGASIVGPSMLDSDIKMRVLDLYGNAKRSYEYLDAETKQVLTWYCEGFNQYLQVAKDEFPLELSLLGIEPKPLEPIDMVSVTHFVGFFHSQNMDDEILSLNLAALSDVGPELLPLSINLDRTRPLSHAQDTFALATSLKPGALAQRMPEPLLPYPKLGSNNWAISAARSQSGKPILSNDPHVDARLLPGTFYPIGLICPEFKAAGIVPPGIPGLLCGRNEFVSFGVTNAYGDSQDLFLEEIEGDSYLQEGTKKPLKTRREVIKIKDSADVILDIRMTERGPIISDFDVFNILADADVSMRWSLAVTQSHTLGFDRLMDTKNVEQFREVLTGMDNMFFNYVLADVDGNIAHQSTGLVPTRADRSGEMPKSGNQPDNWTGFIPKAELPHTVNPERGWVGTSNHDTRPDDYPYFYSNHFSPYYRYERQKEIFAAEKQLNADDMWSLIFDVKNMQAEEMVPLFVDALKQEESTRDLAEILKSWNQEDEINEVGAAVFTVLYNELLYLVLDDELPDAAQDMYWENVYYWNQRVDSMLLSGHAFIDNRETPETETLDGLIVEAGIKTRDLLTKRLGPNPEDWTWGKIHTVRFASPIRQKGFGAEFLGAEELPKQGSNQTLNRGGFVKNRDRTFETGWFSSFRMVADMNDPEKFRGVLSGGSASRMLHPYYKSQLAEWKSGEWLPYWISKERILENAKYELMLE